MHGRTAYFNYFYSIKIYTLDTRFNRLFCGANPGKNSRFARAFGNFAWNSRILLLSWILLNGYFGRAFEQKSAEIQVDTTRKDKKWIGFSSGISLTAQFYRTSSKNPRQVPFMYSISGAPSLDIKGLSLPFSVIYSNQVFSYQQPFNQFGIAPRFKFGTVYLGTGSMRLSNYTLAGQRFSGLGADLSFAWFRIAGMYGRLRRQVNPANLLNNNQTFIHENEAESFKRRGYAMKIGFGRPDMFVDFIYFKAYDVIPDQYNAQAWKVKPAENAILGINSALKIGKKLLLKNDWAVSAYTRDVTADTIEIKIDQLRKLASSILMPTLTTQARIAGESSLKFIHKIFSPSISYKRVELDYTSAGAYFFQTDIQQITAASNLILLKNRLNIYASFGRISDNLQKQRLRTSYRNIGSLNVNYNPSNKWGLNLVYTNFGITQSPLPLSITDTTRINQVNNSLTIIPRYHLLKEQSQHSFTLVAGYNAMNNLGASFADAANTTCYNINFAYSLNYLPWLFMAGITPSYIKTQTIAGSFLAKGLNLSMGKNFFKNQLTLNYMLGQFANSLNEKDNGSTFTQVLSFTCQIPKWPVASINIQHINNKTLDQTTAPAFNELIATVSVSYNF